jgi:hypothetical protein
MFAIIMLGGFVFIGLGLYLGRSKIKIIDQVVLGYEIANDSDNIFYKAMRLMNYGGAFVWRMGAKRSKLLYLNDRFDKKFQRPFKLFFFTWNGRCVFNGCAVYSGQNVLAYNIEKLEKRNIETDS